MLMYTYVYIYICLYCNIHKNIIYTNPETEKKCICRYMYVYINIYVERHGPRVATSPFFLYRAAMALVPSSRQTNINKKHSMVHVVIGLRMEIVKSMQSLFFPFSNSCVTSFCSRMRFTSSSILLHIFLTQWAQFTCPPLKFLSCQQM